MRAVVKCAHGSGHVEVREVDKPVPQEGEVLIAVKAAGICGTDVHIYMEDNYPIHPPVTLGHELSGVVVGLGPGVKGVALGERVVSETYYKTCGHCIYCRTGRKNLCNDRLSIGSGVNGAMTDYVVVPASNIHILPDSVPFLEGALTEPLACCVQAVLEKAHLSPNDRVVLTGPGTMGLLCLQIIKLFNCPVIVLGTHKDRDRLELAKKLGADQVLYSEEAETLPAIIKAFQGLGATVAFDCSGVGPAIRLCMDALRKGGVLVQVGLASRPVELDVNEVALKELTYVGTFAQKPCWWDAAVDLMASEKIHLDAIVTHRHTLDQWQEGFDEIRHGVGLKHVIIPDNATQKE